MAIRKNKRKEEESKGNSLSINNLSIENVIET